MKVADEVWIVMALLHVENPLATDFSVEEVKERAAKEELVDERRPGVNQHIQQHCVANRPPSPNDYRMLFESRPRYRRLFRVGDPHDPKRRGKITPEPEDIPRRYQYLLEWYEEWTRSELERVIQTDPLLALYGSGRHIWDDEHADEYVARLRAGWE